MFMNGKNSRDYNNYRIKDSNRQQIEGLNKIFLSLFEINRGYGL